MRGNESVTVRCAGIVTLGLLLGCVRRLLETNRHPGLHRLCTSLHVHKLHANLSTRYSESFLDMETLVPLSSCNRDVHLNEEPRGHRVNLQVQKSQLAQPWVNPQSLVIVMYFRSREFNRQEFGQTMFPLQRQRHMQRRHACKAMLQKRDKPKPAACFFTTPTVPIPLSRGNPSFFPLRTQP
ncbi:hypothetical protein CC79DRAFT_449970 [Sarocladium strictum]